MTGVVETTNTPDVAFSEHGNLVPPIDATSGGGTISSNGSEMDQDRERERESLHTRESLYTRESFVTARSTGSVDE
jgi:hypothetical protein